MKISEKALMWLVMLNKRLYKKPSFIIIMLIVLAMTAAMVLAAQKGGSIVRIALCPGNDSTALEISNRLMSEKSIINYTLYPSETSAVNALNAGKADAAWIFSEDMGKRIDDYARGKHRAFIKTVELENNVFLRLANEKMYTVVYPYISRLLYKNFMGEIIDNADETVLDKYYDASVVRDSIVETKFRNSSTKAENLNYLTAPLRGILSLMILLCSLASLMYFKQDTERGLFAKTAKRAVIGFVYITISAVNAAVAVLIALGICGLFTNFITEILLMIMYITACTIFCMLIGEFVKSVSVIGAITPALTLAAFIVCPVFISIKRIKFIQFLFPTYYYLSAVNKPEFFVYGTVYIIALVILYTAVRCMKKLKNALF